MDLKVDQARLHELNLGQLDETGIFVRAQTSDGAWISADIVVLDKPSLLVWLKSRGGDNPWAEDVVGLLLDHGHLHDHPPKEA